MNRAGQILLVEDCISDVRLVKEALKTASAPHQLTNVRDGQEALDYLRGEGGYAGRPLPDIILLDLNLPGRNGTEILAEVKADPGLRRIPVVILTTSRAQSDIELAYELHANSYVVKPSELDEFLRTIRTLEKFWMATAKLPTIDA